MLFTRAAFGASEILPGVAVPRVRQTLPYPPPDPSMHKHSTVAKLNYGGSGKDSSSPMIPDDPKPEQALRF